jgi:hypothetical protein
MNESYYVFKRYSLYRASVIAFTLPFFACLLISIVNNNLYHYGMPWTWMLITFTPFLFIGYKIKLEKKIDKLIVYRCFFNILLIKKCFCLCENENIRWQPSITNDSMYHLLAGSKDTGLVVDS